MLNLPYLSYNYLNYLLLFFKANLSSVAVGTTLGWTSPVFPKLTDKAMSDTPLSSIPDPEELAWIGSLVALGALIGKLVKCVYFVFENTSFFFKNMYKAPFVAGPLADLVGRKWTLLTSISFFCLSFVFLLTACSVTHFYIARILQVSLWKGY